jgi:SAM-dependent methyltransferase
MSEPANTVPRQTFEEAYTRSAAPWDIDRAQPSLRAVADRITGSVLDAGCGTGENALFFTARGNQVTGFDFLEKPVAQATQKSAERKLSATFRVADALKLGEWTERFDNAIDSGLFHVFSDQDRARYVSGLATVLKPGGRLFLLCFSEATPGNVGPRRVTQRELREAFAKGWEVESIEPVQFESRPEAKEIFGAEPKAWFTIARRTT